MSGFHSARRQFDVFRHSRCSFPGNSGVSTFNQRLERGRLEFFGPLWDERRCTTHMMSRHSKLGCAETFSSCVGTHISMLMWSFSEANLAAELSTFAFPR